MHGGRGDGRAKRRKERRGAMGGGGAVACGEGEPRSEADRRPCTAATETRADVVPKWGYVG